ncbi:MAG TPA: cell division protein SepF [Acidimicrobiales bacterium]|nr:cell division protein SepF [Acidimicrobiales bacterium]
MAASFVKKTMAYLGLVDDDYDDYDDYEARAQPAVSRVGQRVAPSEEIEEPAVPPPSPRIRTITPSEANGAGVAGRPVTASVRPLAPDRVHIVAPARFADAQEIANRLMSNQPVIVNMQNAERDLQRRMIDFCSGATYALSGGMERVADEVFLLTPSNVKVSDEERQRLADRGLVSH